MRGSATARGNRLLRLTLKIFSANNNGNNVSALGFASRKNAMNG